MRMEFLETTKTKKLPNYSRFSCSLELNKQVYVVKEPGPPPLEISSHGTVNSSCERLSQNSPEQQIRKSSN